MKAFDFIQRCQASDAGALLQSIENQEREKFYVYLLSNKYNTLIYTGITDDLKQKIAAHRSNRQINSFIRKHEVTKLVYYECFSTVMEAIARKKQLKSGTRIQLIRLINHANKYWLDLSDDL